jgi:hypothetical protein
VVHDRVLGIDADRDHQASVSAAGEEESPAASHDPEKSQQRDGDRYRHDSGILRPLLVINLNKHCLACNLLV